MYLLDTNICIYAMKGNYKNLTNQYMLDFGPSLQSSLRKVCEGIKISGKECKTKMNVLGTLDNYSQKNFVGTINFLKGSQKSVGEENEYAILLSDKAKSKATPILLCAEENVDGKHSSSCGKFDAELLFYIESRGIIETDAKKLLVKAKLNKLISKIESVKIKIKGEK